MVFRGSREHVFLPHYDPRCSLEYRGFFRFLASHFHWKKKASKAAEVCVFLNRRFKVGPGCSYKWGYKNPIDGLIIMGNWGNNPTSRSYFTPVITGRGPPCWAKKKCIFTPPKTNGWNTKVKDWFR